MSYAIIGVLTLLFIVFVIFAAKTWHWVNIVFLVLTYLAGLGAAIGMAEVLKLRTTEVAKMLKTEKQAEQLQQQADEAIYGPPESTTYGDKSLYGLAHALDMEMAGRGRVWSGGSVEPKEDNRVFKFASAGTNGEQPGSMQDMLLYVFADQTVLEGPYPVSFIGSMRVVAETADTIELEPVFIANNELFASQDHTWTLFEKMPSDRHDAFYRRAGVNVDELDISAFRAILESADYMPPELFGLDPENKPEDAKTYEAIIDRYCFDGLKIGDIENWIESQTDRKNPRFDPTPEEIFVEYKFNKKSSKPYQVDADGNITIDGPFTSLGQAVLKSLHAGKDIEFQKDDVVLVDQLNAEGYQRNDGEQVLPFPQREDVTEVSRRYFRQLRDYPFLLRGLKVQTEQVTEETQRIVKNNEETQRAEENAQSQIEVRDDLIAKLSEDRERLTADLSLIKQLLANRSMQLDELREKAIEVEKAVRDQHAKLKTVTRPRSQTIPTGFGG